MTQKEFPKEEGKREQSDFNFLDFLRSYSRYWWVFTLSLLLALAVARYYNWYATSVFAITAKLMVKDENAAKDRLLQQLEVEGPATNIENEMEILRSHELLARVLGELDFDVSYYLLGRIKVSEVYTDCPFYLDYENLSYAVYSREFYFDLIDSLKFTIRFDEGGAEREFAGTYGVPVDLDLGTITVQKRANFPAADLNLVTYDKRLYSVRFNTLAANQNKYLSRFTVGLVRPQSTILQVYLEDEVPQKGLAFMNKLVEVYLASDVEAKNSAASNTADFLDDQLQTITADLVEIETNRERYKVSKGIIDLQSESQMVLESMKDADAQRAINDTRVSMISQLEQYIQENKTLRDLAPASLDIDDPLLIKLINKLSELQSEREKILNRSTVNDPGLIPLNAEIDLTRNSLLENIRNIKRSLIRQASTYQSAIDGYRKRMQRIPTTERELLEIERQFRIQESLYVFLLEKRAELSISLAAAESTIRVVDQPRVIPTPVSPLPQKAYSLAILFGLLIPALAIFVREKLTDTIEDLGSLKKYCDIPLLGVVRFNKDGGLVAHKNPRSSIAEEFRSIRTNLSFFQKDSESGVILITSSVGTEGKTFTAVNLALMLAASGKKTVLIGLDLRKPRIVQDFEISNEVGCSNYLSGNANLDDILVPSGVQEDLTIIPSGPIPPNPSELILSDRMKELLSELRARFDRVIIDTPPIGLVSDGLILMDQVDTTLFVVREGVTRKGYLTQANQLYANQQLTNAGLIYNAVKRQNAQGAYRYGGGYGYGYVYGGEYGRYFDDESKSRSSWFSKGRGKA